MSPLAWALSTLLALHLAVVEPLWGRREYRRLQQRSPTDEKALVRAYRLTLVDEWSWVGYLAILAFMGLVPIRRLVTPPGRLVVPEPIASTGPGLVGGVMIGALAAGIAVGVVVARQSKPGGRATRAG